MTAAVFAWQGVSAGKLATESGSTKTVCEFCVDSFLTLPLLRIMNDLSFPGDQCRRTVSDTLFCQYVGIIPGFHWLCYSSGLWRPGITPAGEGGAIVLPSAAKHDPVSMAPGSKQLCLSHWQHEDCAIVAFGDLYWCSNTHQSMSWKPGEWKHLCRCCVRIFVNCNSESL